MKLLLTILITTLTITTAYTQNYRWANGFGGPNSNTEGTSIATDAQANVYVIGSFGDNIDFDPGPGVAILNMQSFSPGIFVAKYDSAGIYQWAFSLNGYNGYASHLAVNATGLYITGCFYGTTDFDPSPLVANLTANAADIFLAKYDFSGNYQWAKNIGGPDVDHVNSIALDDLGNSYITGYFEDSADFDPTASVFNLISENGDAFFAKYDLNGDLNWVHDLSDDTSSFAYGLNISCYNNDQIFISGNFEGTIDFDRDIGIFNLSAQSQRDIYVSKYDSSGNFEWCGQISGTSIPASILDMKVTQNGLCLAGGFSGTTDFDLNLSVFNLTSSGFSDIYFSKYDLMGNLLFAKYIGDTTTNTDYPSGLAITQNGDIFMTGYFNGTVDFDPNIGVYPITASGPSDMFFAKYDAIGNYQWAKGMGGSYTDQITAIALDNSNNQYLTGYFTNSIDADPSAGIAILSPAQSLNVFIGKYIESPNTISNHLSDLNNKILVYPNPVRDILTFDIDFKNQPFNLKIFDQTGRAIYQIQQSETSVNISKLAIGVYYVEISVPNSIYRTKFIKQ